MVFTDVCIITDKVLDVADFYEKIFNVKAEGDSIHSFIKAAGLGIVIYSKNAAETEMGFDFSDSGNGMTYIGYNVDDVDKEYERIKSLDISDVTVPHLWPWGAKSFNFKDIEGNRIVFRSWPK